MSRFEARAHLKVREGQLEGFKRQAAEMMRVTREKDTGTLAYDPEMAFYGDPSPRLIALVGKVGVDAEWFTRLQALEPASAR